MFSGVAFHWNLRIDKRKLIEWLEFAIFYNMKVKNLLETRLVWEVRKLAQICDNGLYVSWKIHTIRFESNISYITFNAIEWRGVPKKEIELRMSKLNILKIKTTIKKIYKNKKRTKLTIYDAVRKDATLESAVPSVPLLW